MKLTRKDWAVIIIVAAAISIANYFFGLASTPKQLLITFTSLIIVGYIVRIVVKPAAKPKKG